MVSKTTLARGECPVAFAHHRLLRSAASGLSPSSSTAVRTPRTEELQQTSLPNLPHQPAPAVGLSGSVLSMSTQSVGISGRPVSAMHTSRSLVFKNLQLVHVLHVKLSCALDHLSVQRQSSAPVSEFLGIGCAVRERQQLQLLQIRSSFQCCDCQLSIVPSALALRRIPRHACSVAKHAVSPPPTVGDTFHKLSLCRSTTGCGRVHQNSVCPRPPRCTYSSFVINPVALRAGTTFPALSYRGHSELTFFASDPAHAIDRQQLSQARFVLRRRRPKDARREVVHLARPAILPDCMQTAVGKKSQAHGTQNEEMWFSRHSTSCGP